MRCGWVATRGTDVRAVARRIDFDVVRETTHDEFDVGLRGLISRSFVVLCGDGWDSMHLLTPSHAADLSRGGSEALHFFCDDTSMGTTLLCFRDGKETWSLEYSGAEGVSEPVMTGAPPLEWAAILERCRAAQRASTGNVDHLYDAAPALGEFLTGFRHDHFNEGALFVLREA